MKHLETQKKESKGEKKVVWLLVAMKRQKKFLTPTDSMTCSMQESEEATTHYWISWASIYCVPSAGLQVEQDLIILPLVDVSQLLIQNKQAHTINWSVERGEERQKKGGEEGNKRYLPAVSPRRRVYPRVDILVSFLVDMSYLFFLSISLSTDLPPTSTSRLPIFYMALDIMKPNTWI
jgi:hypothetical protein